MVLIDAIVSVIISVLGGVVLAEKLPVFATAAPWLIISLWAATQLAASGLIIYGFKNLEAQIASLVIPIEVLFGTFFGYLFFRQVLPTTTLVGGLIIVSAAVVAGLENK